MEIFQGITESLLFVVERWNKHQNTQQEILFTCVFTDLSYDYWLLSYEAYTVAPFSQTLSQYEWKRPRSVIALFQ